MCESLKATYILLVTKLINIFSCQQIWKMNQYSWYSGHEKNVVVNTEVQNGSCVKYSILGDNDWLSAIFYLDI